ncbi:hypothetical protein [Flavobacterium pallidum]|uniref:Uncharacterized protein n=1 Tax=Flavobacterium pallidum TaxID=2172098 RepID=A0A2S1SF06_9FLAO|nr:hypothetical protein [Flavobacterium pallidum]AWI24993.1 hypothetical protein HYN49_03285 [Flavobacterium pallidum]
MMQKLLFLTATVLSTLAAPAQKIQFQLTKSGIFQDEYKTSQIALTEEDGLGGFWIVRNYVGGIFSGAQGYYFEHYDKDMKLLKDGELQIKHPVSEKDATVFGVFMMNNSFHIIEMYYDLNAKLYKCVANSVDNIDLKVSKKTLFELSREEIKQAGSFSLNELFSLGNTRDYLLNNDGFFVAEIGQTEAGFFDFTRRVGTELFGSNAGSGLSVVVNNTKSAFTIVIDLKGKKEEAAKIFLFDAGLNQKFTRILTKENNKRKYFFQNVNVSDDGKAVYVLSKYYAEELKQKASGGKYVFELTKISGDSESMETADVEEHFVSCLKTITFDEKLFAIGFYSDLKDNRYKGVAYFEFDPATMKLVKSKFSPFTDQFITDKYGNATDKELKYLTFKDFRLTADKNIILNAEEAYITQTHDAMTGGNTTYFNFDDIVSVKLNTQGDLLWARNINKSQSTTEVNYFLSYSSAIYNDEVYFFINAAEKVRKISNNRIQFRQVGKNRSNLNIIRIDKNGDFDFQEILDDEQNEVPFMVSKGKFSGGNCFFLGRRGKDKQLLKVTL